MGRALRRGVLVLLLLVLIAGLLAWGLLKASLATLDGERAGQIPGLMATTLLERDALGYVTVQAGGRLDVARALGYAHAQERFFQMDLMRRNAAGELSELVGEKALPLDKQRRVHRFRHRADQALAALEPAERALLDAYVDGVNAGLRALAVRPPEYLLLRQAPRPWVAQDTLLVVYGMYLDLQGSQGRDDIATGWLKASLPADWSAFLLQHSADWQAAQDDSRVEPVPLPGSPLPEALRTSKVACSDCRLQDARDIGSNNWAVAGRLTPHGHAILADDMHLGLRVPGTWFKARLRWNAQGQAHDVAGVTLPGAPLVVAGSNGQVAWGFTNSTADWADVVELRLDAAGTHYQSGSAEKPLQRVVETIAVAGGASQQFEVLESEWGPVLPQKAGEGRAYALRWVAHDIQGLNLKLLRMESVRSVDEAVQSAAGTGIPAQNLIVADAAGHIGWTIIGAMPQRVGVQDMDSPQDWSDGRPRWQGYRAAADYPRLIDPADGRLWTANSRMIGGAALQMLGNGGYDLGARAQQIRDGLRSRAQFDEAALEAIQLDQRALLMQRWRRLLLDSVLTNDFVNQNDLAEYRRWVKRDADAARADSVGYLLVRSFREQVLRELFAPLAGQLEAQGLKLRDLKMVPETPGWALIQARRGDTLPDGYRSWTELLQNAVLKTRDELLAKHGRLEAATWGADNVATLRHPLSAALPGWIANWLDMPPTPMSGDSHMPRVYNHGHGQSERMVVAPGREASGQLVIPAGQSGHPLSPFYRADHEAWLQGRPTPFLPGPSTHRLVLKP